MDEKQKEIKRIQTGKRALNSVLNGIVSSILSVFLLFLSFFSRTVFIHRLSAEYLGLNGVFSNVLNILALSELGIGNAMSYALYRPVQNNDEGKICALMRAYRLLYLCVGLFIIIAGIAVTPLLQFLIRDMPTDMPDISLYFLLFVISMAVPYFFSYKRTLIICYQKEYVVSLVTGVVKLLTIFAQLLILIVTDSYLWYLIAALLFVLVENIYVSHLANKMFPFLESDERSNILPEEKATILENTKAVFFHKIGGTLAPSIDHLIISKVLGLVQTGLYSNYTALTNSINNIFSRIIISSTPSLGNLMVETSKEHAERIFCHILFVNAWICGFVCTCFLCLLQPFISIWLGNAYILSDNVVFFLVAYTYLTNMRLTVLVFKDSTGIFVQDRYKPLIEGCVNVAVSIPLAIKFGIPGVLAGTLISIGCISFWWEALALFKNVFDKGICGYMFRQMKHLVFNGAVMALCYYLCNLICVENVLIQFTFKVVLCLIVPNLFYLLFFRRSEDLGYIKNALMK